jgi:P27 family predicted phage terminase small subunit
MARGSFRASRHGRHPANDRKAAHRVNLDPPEDLSAEARAEWDAVVARLASAGTLAETDDLVIAAYARLAGTTGRLQREVDGLPATHTTTAAGRAVQHPAVGQLRQYRLAQRAYLAELGLTPQSRIAPTPTDGELHWEEFQPWQSE